MSLISECKENEKDNLDFSNVAISNAFEAGVIAAKTQIIKESFDESKAPTGYIWYAEFELEGGGDIACVCEYADLRGVKFDDVTVHRLNKYILVPIAVANNFPWVNKK